MKRTLASLLTLLTLSGLSVFTSCQKETTGDGTQFRATMESRDGKTVLNGSALNWVAGDQVAVYGTAGCGIYSATPQSPATIATLDNVSGETGDGPFRAFYPSTLTTDGATITLPVTQTYVEGSINEFPMYAESSSNQLAFKNLCGVLKLDLTKANINISTITITANAPICGDFTVDNSTGTPNLSYAGNGLNVVTLVCSTPQSITNGKVFYIALPATFDSVKSIMLNTGDGRFCEKIVKTSSHVAVQRNTVTTVTFGENDMEFVRGISGAYYDVARPMLPLYPYYRYSYSQQLILNSEMSGEAAVVTGIDFYYESVGSLSRTVDIYMANTTVSSLNSRFISYDNTTFQQVFSGALTFYTGWTHIEFATPFSYDGLSNIVLTINDRTGSYCVGDKFRVHTASGLSRSEYTDMQSYDPATVGSGISLGYRNDIRLHYDDNAEPIE
ncbi:MAG: hypothetical protein IJ785_01535 [Bacteroidales bacterium]|nr:hypothetical protein [Bacteroidales bacterium]